MSAKITTIFFDLGYTLINFRGNVDRILFNSYLALSDSLISSGYTFNRREFARQYQQIISRYYASREVDNLEQPLELFVNRTISGLGFSPASLEITTKAIAAMFKITEAHWSVERDTHASLARLKQDGYHLCIISNASNTEDLNNLIDQSGLRCYFDQIIISAEEKIRKPHPKIFEIALRKMKANPEESIMVGDTLTADILGAQKAGMRAVWITRRANRPENNRMKRVIAPDFSINRLSKLPGILASIK
jgi:putative hydrolase of the HAD superfamily